MAAGVKKMVILTGYFKGESYGLLGPQMAATVIQAHAHCECIVVGLAREDDKTRLKASLNDYFGRERPVIGFSYLGGRPDLFALAGELRDEGAFTLLAGPQADVDYRGEVGWEAWPHRFKGLANAFSAVLHGPAEKAIELLEHLDGGRDPGIHRPEKTWDERYLRCVDWHNLYRIQDGRLAPHRVRIAQVVQQIGCPHARREKWVAIDPPAGLASRNRTPVRVRLKGCSFCDVAADKGFYGQLSTGTVLEQVRYLPESPDGRKVPFELINENALESLPHLLREILSARIGLSEIHLTLRADWLLRSEDRLREVLVMARGMGIRVLLASVGFESFDNAILRQLNKGLTAETNLRAVHLMRRLKEEFPDNWAYGRSDGANHGFIHPTPWDTRETWTRIEGVIARHGLAADILPSHSTPLLIHHASGLGDWIRAVETREGTRYSRLGGIIEWWQEIGEGSG